MKPAFEIARVGSGLVVIVLNREGAEAVGAALVGIRDSGIKFDGKDRGLLAKLGKDSDTVVLDLDDDRANRFCDVLEYGLGLGIRLQPMVYALGERLAHRLSPGCHFGPRTLAAAA